MPFYEYEPKCGKCEICRGRFMDLQKISDAPHSACPECGQECVRVISAPIVSVRGESFHKREAAERRKLSQAQGRLEMARFRGEQHRKNLPGHNHDCALHGCFAAADKLASGAPATPYLIGSSPAPALAPSFRPEAGSSAPVQKGPASQIPSSKDSSSEV